VLIDGRSYAQELSCTLREELARNTVAAAWRQTQPAAQVP
jgi:hypothetical protein